MDDINYPELSFGEDCELRKSVNISGKRSSVTITIQRMKSIKTVTEVEVNQDDLNLPRTKSEQPQFFSKLDDPFFLKKENPLV